MAHQVTLQLCDGCLATYIEGGRVDLVRRSHRWSFWCEHAVTEDWHPGAQEPTAMAIARPGGRFVHEPAR